MRFFKSHKGLWDGWNSGFAVFYEKVPFQWLTFIGIEGVGGGGGGGKVEILGRGCTAGIPGPLAYTRPSSAICATL